MGSFVQTSALLLLPAAAWRGHCSVWERVKDVLLIGLVSSKASNFQRVELVERCGLLCSLFCANTYLEARAFPLLTTACNAQNACLIRPFLLIKRSARWMSARVRQATFSRTHSSIHKCYDRSEHNHKFSFCTQYGGSVRKVGIDPRSSAKAWQRT